MAIFIVVISHAGIITVNNNTNLPGTPGQYASVQDAIDAANSGDTLMIQGSPIPYNVDVKITKTLVLIGPGYNPQTDNGFIADFSGHQIEFGISSSNSKLIGLSNILISYTNIFAVSNFLFSRCLITGGSFGTDDVPVIVSNISIENCIVEGGCYLKSTPVTFKNNIFTKSSWLIQSMGDNSKSVPHLLKNNLFLCLSNTAWSPGWCNNAIFENNIFFNCFPGDGNIACAFNNNYVFGTKSLPYGTNIGSGNISNQTSVFLNYLCEDDFMSFNFRPLAGSVIINAGTDGTDIGPTGGGKNIYNYATPYPLTGEPPIPQIQKVTMPSSSCPQGGTLNVTVKARKHN